MVSLVISIALWPMSLTKAAEQGANQTAERAPATDKNTGATNSVDDTLKACLARIPKTATAGQHLLAEQNCRGEERMRQEVQAGPHF
ncbi:MAG TPA: hypothetical protein VFS39_01815 [Nitrospira sp.]|nr:hypothetical protein [Nitrospira sp.]